jgi:hypothetical protein
MKIPPVLFMMYGAIAGHLIYLIRKERRNK